MRMLERAGLVEEIGPENFFWSSDQAIVAAEARGCKFCGSAPSPIAVAGEVDESG
jgi:hypothetical protein